MDGESAWLFTELPPSSSSGRIESFVIIEDRRDFFQGQPFDFNQCKVDNCQ